MKYYWIAICDEGHAETTLRDSQDKEGTDELTCSYGHPIVTLMKRPVADIVQVSLLPAAFIDEVNGEIYDENRYFLLVTDLCQGEERRSLKNYLWDEIVGANGSIPILNRFRKVNSAQAWKRMDSLDR